MESSTLWLLLCSLVAVFCFIVFGRRSSAKLPPGPRPLPIVGNLFQLGPFPHESMAEMAKTYGPIMTLQFGSRTNIVLTSVEASREALQKNDKLLVSRSIPDVIRSKDYHLASVAWLPSGPTWRKLRMLLIKYIFAGNRLDASAGLRKEKIRDIISLVADSSRDGKGVNIGRLMHSTMMNLISNTAFSVDLVDIRSPKAQEFKDLTRSLEEEAGKPNISDFFPIIRPLDLMGLRKSAGDLLFKLFPMVDGFVNERRRKRAEGKAHPKNDFLDALLNEQEDKDGVDLTDHEIRNLFLELILGGTDTSSDTVEWAMSEVLRHPDVMAKAKAEIAEKLGDKPVEEADATELPYLRAIVKETLRLHPPAPLLIPRLAEAKFELFGYTVPKGAQVTVNEWAILRDEKLWPEPLSFKPERFLNSIVDFRGQNFEFLPFGTGRRVCAGLALADRMMHTILASLLQKFDWKLPDGMKPEEMDMRDKFGLTLEKLVPLYAIPILIENKN